MILIDTHVLIWLAAQSREIPRSLRQRLDAADSILVSAVSCWEIATLASRGRIRLDQPPQLWVSELQDDSRFSLVSLSPQMALSSGDLDASGFHGDPADRLIYATALHLRVPLATKDQRIRSYAKTAPGHLKVHCLW